MQIIAVCNLLAYGNTFDSKNIRQHVSSEAVRSVPADTMTGYHDLCDFESDVIVGEGKMAYSISEVAMQF